MGLAVSPPTIPGFSQRSAAQFCSLPQCPCPPQFLSPNPYFSPLLCHSYTIFLTFTSSHHDPFLTSCFSHMMVCTHNSTAPPVPLLSHNSPMSPIIPSRPSVPLSPPPSRPPRYSAFSAVMFGRSHHPWSLPLLHLSHAALSFQRFPILITHRYSHNARSSPTSHVSPSIPLSLP